MSSFGERRWIRVLSATITTGSANPASAADPKTTGMLGMDHRRNAVARQRRPAPSDPSSPNRRTIRAASTPPMMPPTPIAVTITEMNSEGWPRPLSAMAKPTDSIAPIAHAAMNMPLTARSNAFSLARKRNPAEISARQARPDGSRRGCSTATSANMAAAITKQTASRIATAKPPAVM
ncbi:hypothetical protein STSO111631_21050 [Stackebrandtia soli]